MSEATSPIVESTGSSDSPFVYEFEMPQQDLFSGMGFNEEGSWFSQITKVESDGFSSQAFSTGRKEHPFDLHKAKALLLVNEHHSTCIHAKVNATVGVGHVTTEERAARKRLMEGDPLALAILKYNIGTISKVDEVLDPFCETSWQETISDVCQDFWQTGQGYLEVVRNDSGSITGLHHIPAEDIYLVLEDDNYNRHWEVVGNNDSGTTRRFALFGDLADFKRRRKEMAPDVDPEAMMADDEDAPVSEVIQFRQPTSLSRWYGYPDWLSGVASIELMKCLRQWKYDFFNNRGVPEFMLFLLGQKLTTEQWETVKAALNANIGKGNSHKSIALNLENPEIVVQLEKLSLDNKGEDTFDKTSDTLAVSVVTSHRVPPLLAGILIPGKLGANNELPNSLVAFQTLVIGPAQRIFQQTLKNTLGDSAKNGGLGLSGDDFALRRILDAYDMDSADTMSRMRQTLPEANAEGRDLSAGVRKQDAAQTMALAKTARDLAKSKHQYNLADTLQAYIDANEAKAA